MAVAGGTNQEGRLNREKTPLYTLARLLVGLILRVFGVRARGMENFPKDTNFIVIGNHISAWDPLAVALFYKDSEIHYMSKEELFHIPVLRGILRKLHAISVNRGETDMAAMRASMQVLRDGHVLGIFPQGTRQPDSQVRGIETGVAVIAMKSTVPLVPVMLTGKYRPFGRVRVVVGEPIDISDLRAQRPDAQTLEAVKARIVTAMEALMPFTDF